MGMCQRLRIMRDLLELWIAMSSLPRPVSLFIRFKA